MDIKLTTELMKRRKGGKIESCYSIMQSSFHYFPLINCTLEATALSLCPGVKGLKGEKFSLDWRSKEIENIQKPCPVWVERICLDPILCYSSVFAEAEVKWRSKGSDSLPDWNTAGINGKTLLSERDIFWNWACHFGRKSLNGSFREHWCEVAWLYQIWVPGCENR